MPDWGESFLGQYQKFQGNEAEKESAKLARELAALQKKQAASGGQTSAETDKHIADLTNQMAQLTKLVAQQAEAKPHIPADKGGPCVTCGIPISFNSPACPTCTEPDAGRKAKEKWEEEEHRRQEEENRLQEAHRARSIAEQRAKEERDRRDAELAMARMKEEEEKRQAKRQAKEAQEKAEKATREAKRENDLRTYRELPHVQEFLGSSEGLRFLSLQDPVTRRSRQWNAMSKFAQLESEMYGKQFSATPLMKWEVEEQVNLWLYEVKWFEHLRTRKGKAWLKSPAGQQWKVSPEGRGYMTGRKNWERKKQGERRDVIYNIKGAFGSALVTLAFGGIFYLIVSRSGFQEAAVYVFYGFVICSFILFYVAYRNI